MFWTNFFSLCTRYGFKPNQVALKIGVSSGILTKWKNGAIPNGETLLKIADYFHCSVDYLLGRTDDLSAQSCSEIERIFSSLNTKNQKNIMDLAQKLYRQQQLDDILRSIEKNQSVHGYAIAEGGESTTVQLDADQQAALADILKKYKDDFEGEKK